MDVAGKVLHGTCGWSDPSIVTCGRFYPGAAKTSADKLEVHSRTFGCVEVDSSLYSIPSAFNVQKWVDSVPKGYVFHFKAFGLFCGSTQGCPTNALPRRVREQLASYLLAKPTVTLKDLPDHAVKSIWAAFGACVEPAVKEWLRSINVALVAADELVHETLPASRNAPVSRPAPLMPIALHVIHPRFFYIRLHRREGKQERLLADSEVADWATRIDALRPQLKGPVYFLWGTDWEDAPVVNAKRLQAALSDACRFGWAKRVRQQTATKRNSLTTLLAGAASKVAKLAQGRSSLPVGTSTGFKGSHGPQGRVSMPPGGTVLSTLSASAEGVALHGSHRELHDPHERASLPAGTSAGIAEQAHAHSPADGRAAFPEGGAAAAGFRVPQTEKAPGSAQLAHAQGRAAFLMGSAVTTGAGVLQGYKDTVPGTGSANQPVYATAMLHSGGIAVAAAASGAGSTPGGALGRAALLSSAACGNNRRFLGDTAPGSAPPPLQHARASLLSVSATAAAIGAASTPGSAQGALARAALISNAAVGSHLSAQACKTSKPATAPNATTSNWKTAPNSAAPPATVVKGSGASRTTAGNGSRQRADKICDTAEKRSSEAPNATQCSTPELKRYSSQVSQSSIATPVTPQSPQACNVPTRTVAGDCDAGKEQSGAWGNSNTHAGPPNLLGTSWFAPPTSERGRGTAAAADVTACKSSFLDIPDSQPDSPATEWTQNASAQGVGEASAQPGSPDVAAMTIAPGQEVHTATTNLANKFSKLVQKVPASALQAANPPDHPTAASGNAATKSGKKDSKKSIVGAMDAFVKSAMPQHTPAAGSVATCATGAPPWTTSHKTKGQELLAQAVDGAKDTQPTNTALCRVDRRPHSSTHAFKPTDSAAATTSSAKPSATATAVKMVTASAADKAQPSSGKGEGKATGGSRKGGSKAHKAQEKAGGMRQATLGQFFGR